MRERGEPSMEVKLNRQTELDLSTTATEGIFDPETRGI